MSADSVQVAWRNFADALALYDLEPLAHIARLVDGACALLLVGFDSPGVEALAGLPLSEARNPFVLAEIVIPARDELGLAPLSRDEAQIRATQAMTRRWQVGVLTDRELARWTHETVTHQGADVLQDLVVYDDILDRIDAASPEERSAHDDLVGIVAAVLALPDPWANWVAGASAMD